VETAHQSLTAIDCDFIVCCVDRPKLLEHRGYKYCQVPFGDAPSAQAELREKMAATYSFIDNARWVQSLAPSLRDDSGSGRCGDAYAMPSVDESHSLSAAECPVVVVMRG
jgi:hypothetical protein